MMEKLGNSGHILSRMSPFPAYDIPGCTAIDTGKEVLQFKLSPDPPRALPNNNTPACTVFGLAPACQQRRAAARGCRKEGCCRRRGWISERHTAGRRRLPACLPGWGGTSRRGTAWFTNVAACGKNWREISRPCSPSPHCLWKERSSHLDTARLHLNPMHQAETTAGMSWKAHAKSGVLGKRRCARPTRGHHRLELCGKRKQEGNMRKATAVTGSTIAPYCDLRRVALAQGRDRRWGCVERGSTWGSTWLGLGQSSY
ncbi:hypothetical protein QBC39DRAFT_168326 [Podospora conica]|nr:hypothetical protein QBC39DRAFT_168326 [Schizothecium conicum]